MPEPLTAPMHPDNSNASSANNEIDNRSDNKGPEPEVVAIAGLFGQTNAFISLGRIGGVTVFNVGNPEPPAFTECVNKRDFAFGENDCGAADFGDDSGSLEWLRLRLRSRKLALPPTREEKTMINLPRQLAELQPATGAAFQRALHTVLPFTDARLLAYCKAQLQAAQRRQVCPAPADCSTYERGVLALADQFAVAVDGISEELMKKLVDDAGAEAVNALVNALYLLDMTLRLELVVPVVLGASTGRHAAPLAAGNDLAAPGSDSRSTIGEAIADFAAAAVLANDVDPITSELVRLRCAQTHHCRLCGSLRQRTALDAGFDETMADRVARYETAGFGSHQVVALRLCDVLIMQPADARDVLGADLERCFTPTQIAEICFDVVKWSQQKALVAMHADAPPWEGVHILDFDPQGHPVFSGPV